MPLGQFTPPFLGFDIYLCAITTNKYRAIAEIRMPHISNHQPIWGDALAEAGYLRVILVAAAIGMQAGATTTWSLLKASPEGSFRIAQRSDNTGHYSINQTASNRSESTVETSATWSALDLRPKSWTGAAPCGVTIRKGLNTPRAISIIPIATPALFPDLVAKSNYIATLKVSSPPLP